MGHQAGQERSWPRGRTVLRSWEGRRSWAQMHRLSEAATCQDCAISEGQEKKRLCGKQGPEASSFVRKSVESSCQ